MRKILIKIFYDVFKSKSYSWIALVKRFFIRHCGASLTDGSYGSEQWGIRTDVQFIDAIEPVYREGVAV